MKRQLTVMALSILLSLPVQAEDRITRDQIEQIIRATDWAAANQDAKAIGMFLGDSFEKVIEFVYKEEWLAKVRLDKEAYLELITEGWTRVDSYQYQRDEVVINIMPGNEGGESYSTITEQFVLDGEPITSRFREYAVYRMEMGWPVITQISGHTLVGDTTPEWQEQLSRIYREPPFSFVLLPLDRTPGPVGPDHPGVDPAGAAPGSDAMPAQAGSRPAAKH